MKISKPIILLLLLYFSAGVYSSPKKATASPYFFIHLTDPQFGMFEKNKGFEKETKLYKQAVEEINRLNPDFVVITGDFVHNKSDSSQIAEFKRITRKIDSEIPVCYTPGNHDVGLSPTRQDIEVYESNYGDDRFSFRHKKSRFIGFNSSIIKDNTPGLEQEQYDWLKEELAQSKTIKHIMLFGHYPFFIEEPEEPENYSNIGMKTRKKYLDLFKTNKIKAVFAGHYHDTASTKYGEMEMIITGAVGKPLGDAPSGFRIVKVYDDHIKHNYYSLDAIPDSISF